MNKTFSGDNFSYNACVGNNGHVDFLTYSDGYDAIVKLGLENIDNINIPIDILVYPLIYSARHRIELFLKHQLIKLDFIKNRILSNKNTQQIIGTHEISKLWQKFKDEAEFEPRFKDAIDAIDEYIGDFSQIDDTGEVFRYPNTIGGDKHLANLGLVNLLSFKNRYLELTEKLHELDYHSSFLFGEYQQKTVAGNLSREMIKKLAQELPPIIQWNVDKENFSKIKQEIQSKYSISSTTLSKAIDIIKKNREFSLTVGKELIIQEITPDELIDFINIYGDYMNERSNGNFQEIFNKYYQLIKDRISTKAIASIAQIYDIGYFRLYPEEYELGLEMKLQEDADTLIRFYLLGNGIVKEKLLNGLKILNQNTLLMLIKL